MGEDGSVRLEMIPGIAENKTTAMRIYPMIRIFSNACDKKNVSEIKGLSEKIHKVVDTPVTFLDSVTLGILSQSEARTEFKNRVIDILLSDIYNKYQNDNDELLFAASAKFEIRRLEEVIEELKDDSERINQTRYSDSAIIFVLKYGNITDENFASCMKTLIEANIDVNKFDFRGKTATDYVAMLYKMNKDRPEISETLRKIARLFLDQEIVKPDNQETSRFLMNDMQIDFNGYKFRIMDDKTQLFYWIVKNQTGEFLKFPNIKDFVNSDNGENTLLQEACKRKDNMLPVVRFLLNNGADPNGVTRLNSLTPLELAATKNNQQIFAELLKNKKTLIEQRQYDSFVKGRSQSIKPKLFEMFLESNKLDPTFTYEKTGNTPLHYALFFYHQTAIENLLNRSSSLVAKNKSNVSALDLICAEDLEKHFDSRVALDNYSSHFNTGNYKMRFRFKCLVDREKARELQVVSKIGKNPNIEHLLMHPLIHTFIILKWFRMKKYFWFSLFVQTLIFLLLSLLLYRLPNATVIEYISCIFLTLVNIVLKQIIFLNFYFKSKFKLTLLLESASLHGCFEILLIATIIGSFFQYQLRAFVFVEMAISFLLTAGYHPKLAKWSVMLQKVFKTFTVLLLFFSIIVVAYSVGFKILFPDDVFFKNFFTSIFRSFIMTTGEFNIAEETGLDTSGFGAYLIFFLFAMSMSLVIVNFWTGVAVTDIERIEKNSEVSAFKNVIIFMSFVDYIYGKKYLSKLRDSIPNPLLFSRIDQNGSVFHRPDEIDFFVNKTNQIEEVCFPSKKRSSLSEIEEEKVAFPSKVDDECFSKIRGLYYKSARVSSERVILTKLEELSRLIEKKKSTK